MAISGREILLTEKKGHTYVMTINREERGNSSSMELGDRFNEAFSEAKWDDDVWAVIVTAVGERFFCSGEDLKQRVDLDNTYPGGFLAASAAHRRSAVANAQADFWKPVVGAINGYALAGGWSRAQSCDVRIAAEHARFGVPEVRWNLPAPFMAQCARMIPMGIVLEMTMWGARQYTAQRMYEVGFVNKVVPKEQLMDEALQWCEEIYDMGPRSVWAHKQLIYQANFYDNEIVRSLGSQLFVPVSQMEDSVEGPKAFAEKRKPVWKLR